MITNSNSNSEGKTSHTPVQFSAAERYRQRKPEEIHKNEEGEVQWRGSQPFAQLVVQLLPCGQFALCCQRIRNQTKGKNLITPQDSGLQCSSHATIHPDHLPTACMHYRNVALPCLDKTFAWNITQVAISLHSITGKFYYYEHNFWKTGLAKKNSGMYRVMAVLTLL